MLTEIYCDAFGSQKNVPFSFGLNVIQGIGNSEDQEGSNSIGKSSMLKIIDYAFGGDYYAQSNSDVIKHVGEHDVCFTHRFGSEEFSFRRSANAPGIVIRCVDKKYEPQREMSSREFCEWLVEQYKIENLDLTFRGAVGLYSRVWNKPNKEVNRPLYNHNAQTIGDAIVTLVKLFGKYAPIKELHEHEKYLKKRQQIMQNAVTYNFIEIPSQKESQQILEDISTCEKKISAIRAKLSTLAAESLAEQNQRYNELYEQRAILSTQQRRAMRELDRHRRDIQKLLPTNGLSFSTLQEYFPEVDMNRLKSVEEFHNRLNAILQSELENEIEVLKQRLEDINASIAENEMQIQKEAGIPSQTLEALDELQKTIEQKEKLQERLSFYTDKVAEATQKVETAQKLDEVMTSITESIQSQINERILEYSKGIKSSNRKAPTLLLTPKNYTYGVEDNTGTGKAYTDLLLFDTAVLSLTQLPMLIHDSFLFNNVDESTIKSFLELYSGFSDKQVFIALDRFYGDDERIDKLLFQTTRLVLSSSNPLYGKDWRT